eukprot:TRINITY_DN1371_c0_g1_i4.p1 TRINITY_DN1371_c0_g1~~TRINITY_DN1371_c0_g1_i4.p1  ORF type:complete len:185 (-),score=37.74 TRINITY_DN1371_c0_g1_i4:120-674(-)
MRRGAKKGGGRGGRGGSIATNTTQRPQTSVNTPTSPEPAAPSEGPPKLLELVNCLLEQAFASLPETERPQSTEKKQKATQEFAKTFRQILANPFPEVNRFIIFLTVSLQSSGVSNATGSKKIVSTTFTFLLEELTKHWEEYGFVQDEIHPSYHHPLTDSWKANPDLTEEEYNTWLSTFSFLGNK